MSTAVYELGDQLLASSPPAIMVTLGITSPGRNDPARHVAPFDENADAVVVSSFGRGLWRFSNYTDN
jgi:hypothetical protein